MLRWCLLWCIVVAFVLLVGGVALLFGVMVRLCFWVALVVLVVIVLV